MVGRHEGPLTRYVCSAKPVEHMTIDDRCLASLVLPIKAHNLRTLADTSDRQIVGNVVQYCIAHRDTLRPYGFINEESLRCLTSVNRECGS